MAIKKAAKQASRVPLALQVLMVDHAAVDKLFRRYARQRDNAERAATVKEICAALALHAEIEETIFYPEVRGSVKDEDLLDEAEVEHAHIKLLVEWLATADPTEDLYDARVTVLKEYVKHHVEEEETELFPKLKRADLDLDEMGERLLEAKGEGPDQPADTAVNPTAQKPRPLSASTRRA